MKKIENNFQKIDGYEWHKTDDLSWTLFSKKFNESCHSHSGALAETQAIYLNALGIEEKLVSRQKLNILEVGLGAGVTLLLTLELFLNLNKKYPNISLHYISLELDPLLAHFFVEQLDENYKISKVGQDLLIEKENCKIMIIVGDARERILTLQKQPHLLEFLPFDIVFQDAFSPKNNPHLWTVEWFSQLAHLSSDRVELSTYSASKRAQRAMLLSGFKVEVCRGFIGKNNHTKAYGPKHSFVMDKKVEENLRRNPHLALQDAQLVKI